MKTMKMIGVFILLVVVGISMARAGKEKNNIVYKYKQYEHFDFEDLQIQGDSGSPGDLSISPRFQKKFKNNLPYRKNFNAEIKRAIERVR